MSDVLLVNPKSINVLPSYLPYGLLYLAGFLRSSGISINIYDANTSQKAFVKVLDLEKPKIVGISILSGPCLSDAVDKAKIVRERYPKTKIVFGGIHTTIFPKQVLAQNYVDFIVMNEGELPMLELTKFIFFGEGKLEGIKNLGYKKKGNFFLNPIRPFLDLDTLPFPAWDLVPIEKYIHRKFYSDRVLTLHTSRGCPWNCSYCYNQAVNFRRWRGISANKILEQIEFLISNYKIKGFQFYDDEFDVNTKRVEEFCHLLLKKGIKIKWAHYSRTNVANKERYLLEKKAGCEFIEFGVESGSPRILKMIKKQQTITDIKNAFEICKEVGLKAGAMFMIGLPTETEEEIKMTIDLINSLPVQQTICTVFHPYPGSELFDYCVNNGLFPPPKELDSYGQYFDIGGIAKNVSKVKGSCLQKVYHEYAFNNVLQEVKLCWERRNFMLILNHVFGRLNKKDLSMFFKELINYGVSLFARKVI